MIIRTKDFQIPKKLDFETSEITNTYGKFFAEPFERGFGTTVGNSLRRVLLSSIAGAAITSIKIEGVLHEFSTLPGVKEDITDIILNLKSLRVKLHSDRPKTIYLKKNGPCEVRAKDIIHDADVEILTPDLPIATLDKDSSLNVEMNVKIGRGYVPAERNKEEGMSIGTIPVDSIFSPIKRINFYVENARVGRVTDYDKLILEIWTDGSVRPDDALAFAAKILKDHLALFINFEETAELIEPKLDDVKEKFNKNLLRSVNCLKNANIKTISDLVNRSENEMLKTKNFGRKSLNEIKEILSEMGLSLGMKLESVSKGVDNEKEDEPSE
jgi:DNA-directed RNA polymerase subunit alpha